MDLVDQIYKTTRRIPSTEFELRRQMRRAAVSIPSNVAEGFRRKGRRQAYQNHVSIAMGSHGELETELEVALRNGFLDRGDCKQVVSLLDRVGGMLYRLHESLGGN